MDFLKADMKHLFDDQGVDKSQYADKVDFRDPITKFGNLNGGIPTFCTKKLIDVCLVISLSMLAFNNFFPPPACQKAATFRLPKAAFVPQICKG